MKNLRYANHSLSMLGMIVGIMVVLSSVGFVSSFNLFPTPMSISSDRRIELRKKSIFLMYDEGFVDDLYDDEDDETMFMDDDMDESIRETILSKKRGMDSSYSRFDVSSIDSKDGEVALPPRPTMSSETTTSLTNDDGYDDDALWGEDEVVLPVKGMNLERPSFLQSRIAPESGETQQEGEDAESKELAAAKAAIKQEPAVDYMADYDDENSFHVPNRIGISTVDWTGGRNEKHHRAAFRALLTGGVRLMVTSESHNRGVEAMLGSFLDEAADDDNINDLEYGGSGEPLVATAFGNPYRMVLTGRSKPRMGANAVSEAVDRSCERMERTTVDLYQVDATPGIYVGGAGALADGMAKALQDGTCNHVGLAHVGPRTLRTFQKLLTKKYDATLSTVRVDFSLTNRKAIRTIQTAKDLGIVPLATDPTGGGLADATYTATNPTGGAIGAGSRTKYSFKRVLEPLVPLHDTAIPRVVNKVKDRLRNEERNGGKKSGRIPKNKEGRIDVTPYQIAINYVVAKGAVPLPSITNEKEAKELLGCLGWGLTKEEVEILDEAASMCGR